MPLHAFTCRECNIETHDNTTKGVHKCPECGKDMWCKFGGGIGGNYDHPIHSDSLAINPNQRAEHERLFPNIRLDSENRPIFDNYTNHEAYLKKTGFVKQTQKIRSRGKTLKAT